MIKMINKNLTSYSKASIKLMVSLFPIVVEQITFNIKSKNILSFLSIKYLGRKCSLMFIERRLRPQRQFHTAFE